MKLSSKTSGTKVYFDSLDETVPSTITAITQYDGSLNLPLIFHLLVVSYKKENKEERHNHFRITFLRYKKETRGKKYRKEKDEKDYFKESITISIRYKGDNISVKLADTNFHMCGLKSLESGTEIINKLIEEIKICERLLEYIESDRGKFERLFAVIKNRTYMREGKIHFKFNIKPDDEDSRLFSTMILDYSNYMESLEQYYNHLDKILKIDQILIRREPKLLDSKPIMRKYIYSIGMPINRYLAANIIASKSDRFIVQYNNSTQHFVRAKVPFTQEEINMQNKVKKEEKYHHFFLYKTGTISQTGMHYETMRKHFDELKRIIQENYEEIIYMDMDFLLDECEEEEYEDC